MHRIMTYVPFNDRCLGQRLGPAVQCFLTLLESIDYVGTACSFSTPAPIETQQPCAFINVYL